MTDTRHNAYYGIRAGKASFLVRTPKNDHRYVLLGRIRETDEVRPEEGDWAMLQQHPELIPEVMKLPPTEENRQKLLMARLREDERRPRDRREDGGSVCGAGQERRTRIERRRPETAEVVRHRTLRSQVSHRGPPNADLYRYPLGFAALVILGFMLSYLLGNASPEEPPPDCAALPAPGVNWNGCNLSGLGSPSANLIGARMRNARFDAADLSGASLSGADLEYSSISFANLRIADLSHSRLWALRRAVPTCATYAFATPISPMPISVYAPGRRRSFGCGPEPCHLDRPPALSCRIHRYLQARQVTATAARAVALPLSREAKITQALQESRCRSGLLAAIRAG